MKRDPVRRITIAIALLVSLMLDACSSKENAAANTIVRDSAGIRIVQNLRAEWGEGDAWTLSDDPVLEIGVMEGDEPYVLSGVYAVRRLADGTIVLANGGTEELRFFDAEGRHLRTVGGRGKGPGEFGLPVSILLAPDTTLVVWDGSLRRASVFTRNGDFLRTFSLPSLSGRLRFPEVEGFFSDGSILAVGVPALEAMMGVGERWSPHLMAVYPASGGDPVVLGEAGGVQCDPTYDGECAFLAYGGRRTMLFRNDRIYLGYPDRNEFRVLDRNGNLLSITRGPEPLRPVTEKMKEAFREAVMASAWGQAAQRRQILKERTFAKVVPAFGGFVVSEDGYSWAGEYQIEEAPWGFRPAFPKRTEPVRWTVYDLGGRQLGDVSVPAHFMIREIGDDYVLGVFRDDLDVEHVRMYALYRYGGTD